MKLINLQDKFILVSDEEIKEYNYIYNNINKTIEQVVNVSDLHYIKNITTKTKFSGGSVPYVNCKKIIAGIPELPSIDFSLLSEEGCKEIGWVDVEKLALLNNKNKLINHKEQDINTEIWISGARQTGFIEGFKTSQSLNDKRFSLEDVKTAIRWGCNKTHLKSNEIHSFTQSLQQTSWEVGIEMEYPDKCCIIKEGKTTMNKGCMERNHCEQPKITKNSIKLIKIYETI